MKIPRHGGTSKREIADGPRHGRGALTVRVVGAPGRGGDATRFRLPRYSQYFKLPSWRGAPDYSQFVSEPTCLMNIEKRLGIAKRELAEVEPIWKSKQTRWLVGLLPQRSTIMWLISAQVVDEAARDAGVEDATLQPLPC